MSNWDDLERYDRKIREKNMSPIITTTTYSIILSNSFMIKAKCQLEGMEKVMLSYSKLNNAIVFDFINCKDSKSLNINYNGSVASISTHGFYKYNNIKPPIKRLKYEAKFEEISNIGKKWIIFLNKPLGKTNE